MMKSLRIAALLHALLLVGCAGSSSMVKSEGPPPASPDQATVVFMRSSFVGSVISASVFDVTGTEAKLIGMVNNGTKVAYNVPAGDHTFMVVSEAADFMQAKVDAGKTYYALVTPRMGAWKARFSFKPLRQADFATADFAGWDKSTSWVETGPETQAWATKNAADIKSKRDEYWPEWSGKNADQRESQTLQPYDGR